MIRAFNAGEFSDLVDGRVDLDRYPASVKTMSNTIAAPQGPAIGRSGTELIVAAAHHDEHSELLEFVVSDDDTADIEVSSDRIRFIRNGALQTYAAISATLASTPGATMVFTAASFGASVGDQVQLSGFPGAYQLNGEVANITAVSGNDYTLDITHPNMTAVSFSASRVYHVAVTYTEAQRKSLRAVQSVDVMYLFSSTQTRKLSRFGDFDWRIEDVQFADGPYLPTNRTTTTLTPSTTGNAVPTLTSNTAPSGTAAGSSNRAAVNGTFSVPVVFIERQVRYDLDESQFYFAFDGDSETYWAANSAQSGIVSYAPASAFVCDGYSIHAATDNGDTTYAAGDFAPSDFTFEGFDGADWIVLDEQQSYVLYEGNKSGFFQIENAVAYQAYRLNITGLVRNGPLEPRVQRLVLRDATAATIPITASAVTGINNDQGFLSTDVGRLIRVKGSDGTWRPLRIASVVSTTSITATLQGEPLRDTDAIREWRLGHWSDTTGWPAVGVFLEDRLWYLGAGTVPDLIASSVTGDYENLAPSDSFGAVLDTSGFAIRANSRKLSGARWIAADNRGLLVGLGAEEYALTAPNNEAITPRNYRLRPSTKRGSAAVEPVQVDNQILFVQRGGRIVREHAYVFEADGYRTPSMSQLAGHLGAERIEQMRLAEEPHSIVWCRRSNGQMAGLTYNRDENVIGWHRHDITDAEIESMSVTPQPADLQDALTMSVKRTVGGQTRRYIERLRPFWDFNTELSDAWFVDSGVAYSGAATSVIYGLGHLEGKEVVGLANGFPVENLTVTNGAVTLPFEATTALIGLGFEGLVVVPRLENGAADGTAQGKTKRINRVVVRVWRSFGGEVGVWNEQAEDYIFEPLPTPGRFDEYEDISLYTGDLDPIRLTPGYDKRGQMAFRRPKNSPLPFNVVALMPQLNTQDQ